MIDRILLTIGTSLSAFICLVAADNLSEYFEYADEIGLSILLGTLMARLEILEEKLKKK